MKREAYSHPKMLDLAARLKVKRVHANGIISNLWNWSADAAPQGNIGKWTDAVIAHACEHDGDATEFVNALVESGWIDRCADHRLVIHDLEDHAPEWLKTKLKRTKKWFYRATPPTQVPSASTRASAPASDQCEPSTSGASAPLYSALETSALETSVLNPPTPLAKPEPPKPKRKPPQPTYDPNGALLPASLDVPEFRESWARWILYRRNKRKPVSIDAASEQLETFARYGPTVAVESIRQAIQCDWQGLFPEKVNANGNRPTRSTNNGTGPGHEFVEA